VAKAFHKVRKQSADSYTRTLSYATQGAPRATYTCTSKPKMYARYQLYQVYTTSI